VARRVRRVRRQDEEVHIAKDGNGVVDAAITKKGSGGV